MKRAAPAVRERLQKLLHEIFVAKGGGVGEPFSEDDWLLNMSSRVNGWERLEPDQVTRIEEIWKRVTHEMTKR